MIIILRNQITPCSPFNIPNWKLIHLINNAVEILSLDEELSKEYKNIIKLALPNLIVETPSTQLATAKYRKFIQSAADYTKDGLKNLLIDVVTDPIKKSLWG